MAAYHRADPPPDDRSAFVERYLPLARHLAARHTSAGEPFDDVFQVACIGLVKAVDRFDRGRGVAFSSYATPTIVGEIKRYYRDHTWVVRVPRDLLELGLRVERVADELGAELGRRATAADLAARLRVGEDEVRVARDAVRARRTTSMDERVSHDGETIGERLGADEPGFEAAERRSTLESLMGCLSARDREVIRLRFDEDLTQDEIGSRMHISQMQVCRVLRAAIDQLRTVSARVA